jgi:hypothetical protein
MSFPTCYFLSRGVLLAVSFLALLLTPSLSTAAKLEKSSHSLSKLRRAGEFCVLRMQGHGCFGMSDYEYRYAPLPTPHLYVTDYQTRWLKDPKTGKRYKDSRPRKLAAVL